MARAITIKSFGADEIVGFSKRRLGELFGLGLFGLAFFLILALSSYHRSDPSFSSATDASVQNMTGYAGSYASDILLQLFGLGSIIPIFVCLAWGWRLFCGYRVTYLSFRVTMLLTCLVFFTSLLAFIEAPLSWPLENGLGGSIGSVMKANFAPMFTVSAYVLFSFIVMAVSFPVAIGLRWAEWKAIWRLVVAMALAVSHAFAFLRPADVEDFVYEGRNSTPKKGKLSRLMNKLKRSHEDEEDEAPVRRKVKKDLVESAKSKLSRAGRRNSQPSLELKPAKGQFQLPEVDLLSSPPKARKQSLNESALEQNARLLETVLQDFGVNGEISKVRPGPVVALYELEPAAGTKSSRVVGLADDIARSMSAVSARIAVIPGRNAIGVELPNAHRETVLLRELFEDESYTATDCKLPLALGKDIGGDPIVVDLAKMPHLLVAGTTGSGKSVAINTMIMSLVYRLTPEECKFIMIDPKMLELSIYDGIPHLLTPVVTEPGKAVVALKWTVKEMENRYRLMSTLGVRNIEGYNKRIYEAKAKGDQLKRTVQTGFDPDSGKPIIEEVELDMTPLPFIVVVVDEMADLMLVAGKDIETSIQRLAQMARAAGIHIIMATQRPSVDVITGVIKANFPTRISFQVTSRIDSRTILGEQGAEQLLGQGDMLYMAGGGRITRIQGPFINDKEVESIVSYLKTQGEPTYVEEVTVDPEEQADLLGEDGEADGEEALYKQAVGIVLRDRKASTSYLQRVLKLGYNRAANLIERMEREGIVTPATATGKREILAR